MSDRQKKRVLATLDNKRDTKDMTKTKRILTFQWIKWSDRDLWCWKPWLYSDIDYLEFAFGPIVIFWVVPDERT